MWKIAAAGATALLVTASPLAYAESFSTATGERLSAADWKTVTDLRIDLVKGALQLTPDQAKYWPAVEEAIRNRAKDRQARLEKIIETVGKRAEDGPMEALGNRDPVSFLNRRADALAQRSADLRTLKPEQKRRMAALALFVLRDMSDAVEQRRLLSEEDD
jgi:ABC-type sugar transport system substrate-binding protein